MYLEGMSLDIFFPLLFGGISKNEMLTKVRWVFKRWNAHQSGENSILKKMTPIFWLFFCDTQWVLTKYHGNKKNLIGVGLYAQ